MNSFRAAKFLLIGCCLLLSSCKPPVKESEVFPDRPEGRVPFYNGSSITDVQLLAVSTLKHANELTDIEFAMVLLETLPEGFNIETYAAELFDYWRVGEDFNDRGVLCVLVEDIATMKIEVAYELEPIFPDAFCKSYQDTVKMYFSSKHFGDVISHSINNMVRHSLGEEVANSYSPNTTRDSAIDFKDYLSGGAGITESDYLLNKQERLAEIMDLPEETIARYQASESIHESLMNFIESMEHGINYPYLDVLTQGSHYKRIEYPESPKLLQTKAEQMFDAMPYRITQQGDLATVRFHQDRASFLMFRRSPDGKWRYDLTKSWGLANYSFKNKTFLETGLVNDHPWKFAFPETTQRPLRVRFPELLPLEMNLSKRMDELKKRIQNEEATAEDYIDLANLLFWEFYWIQASISVAEEGLNKFPQNQTLRWLAIYARYRAPLFDGIEPHYVALVEQTRGSKAVFDYYKHFIESTESDPSQLYRLADKYNYDL